MLPFALFAQKDIYRGEISTSYERIYLPGHEAMGLFKTGALFRLNNYIKIGPEIYSAVTGKRGGFFTAGIEAKTQIELISRLRAYGGLYIGAGGGGSAPQGGGLMIRPSAGLSYDLGFGSLEGGISRVWYPNGDIDSTQLHIGFSLPFDGAFIRGGQILGDKNTASDNTTLDITSQMIAEHYVPASGSHDVRSDRATTPFTLAGVEFRIEPKGRWWYGYLEAAGAGAGMSNGYMELFAGIGAKYSFANTLSVSLQGAVGAAGGGRVDTGGGLMYRIDATAQAKVFDKITLGISTGYIGSFEGSFSAHSYGASLGYRQRFNGLGDPDFDEQSSTSAWRFRVENKSYLSFKGMFKDDQVNRIDLIGLSLHRFINDYTYIIGESYWAWQGQAGGYAEGVFGLGAQTPSYKHFRAYAEAKAGVGGGGDVNMDGGIFGALEAGISYDIDRAWQLHAGVGYIRSRTGRFHTYSIRAGIGYNFSLFGR